MGIKFFFRLLLVLIGFPSAPADAASYRFNGTAVAGCERSGSGSSVSYVCDKLDLSTFNDSVVILRGVPVTVNTSVSFGYNQAFTLEPLASLTVNGDLNIGDINASLLSVTGGTLTANGGTFSIGAQPQTITANIVADQMNIGTGSTTRITGSLTAKGAIAIASHVSIVGAVSGTVVSTNSPVTISGDVTASTSFALASGSTVTGNISSGVITTTAAVAINGNVTATNSFTLASGSTVSGNVVAPRIALQASEAYIGGTVRTAAITLDWHGRVAKTITCTDAGSSNCSCVTNNSGYAAGQANGPMCVAAAPAGPDHIEIRHTGSALTCQPQTVTVTACADAACGSNYTGGATVTLAPGGQVVALGSSGVSTAATVQDIKAESATLAATSSPAASAATVCKNSVSGATGCTNAMTFADAGFVLGLPNQLAATATAITLNAVALDTRTLACVPTFAGATKKITFSCGYANPSSGSSVVKLGALDSVAASGSSCVAGGTALNLAFGASGQASLAMYYADAGQLSMTAAYSSGAGEASVSKGSALVVVAPAKFLIAGMNAPIRAGARFSGTVTALNAEDKVTPNFGKETPLEGAVLSKIFIGPTFSNLPTVTDPDMDTGGLAAFSNGVANASDLSWAEVGKIALVANLKNSGGYLGSGLAPTGQLQLTFIPDHFDTAVVSAMACNKDLSSLVCDDASGNSGAKDTGTFVYSGQPFGLTVTARNSLGAVTTNYAGKNVDEVYAKNVTLKGLAGAGSGQSGLPLPPSGSTLTVPPVNCGLSAGACAVVPAGDFERGVASAAVTYRFPVAYTAKADTSKLASPTIVRFRAAEANDAVTSLRAVASATQEGRQTVLTGRLLVPHSYGPTTLPLPLAAQAQYWDSARNWVINALDSSSFGEAAVLLAPYGSKQCPASVVAQAQHSLTKTIVLAKGVGSWRLLPPGAAGPCALDVSVTAFPAYLPSTVGRAVFGIYRAGPVTYQREIFF